MEKIADNGKLEKNGDLRHHYCAMCIAEAYDKSQKTDPRFRSCLFVLLDAFDKGRKVCTNTI